MDRTNWSKVPNANSVLSNVTAEDKEMAFSYIKRKSPLIRNTPHTIWTSVFNFTDRDPGRLMLNEVNILHLRHFIGAQR